MKNSWSAMLSLTLLVVFLSPSEGQTTESATGRLQDEQAIRTAAASYEAAFNQGDAKSLAAMWVEDGEYIDQTGFLLRNRPVIEQALGSFFAQHKGAKIQIKIAQIQFLAEDVASELAHSKTTMPDGKTEVAYYAIVHVKRDGQWKMLSVHETPPPPPSNYEKLKELEWMIGTWVDREAEPPAGQAGSAVVVEINGHWSANRNFIIREFTAVSDGKITNTGTQRIGWHAPSKEIRSWAFDSKGGITTGTWKKIDDRWIVATSEALSNGEVATANESVTLNADGSQTWSITDRARAGRSLPDQQFKSVRIQ